MSTTSAWGILLLAGLCEIVWASALKSSAGLTRPTASVVAFVVSIISFALLALSMKVLPIGTSYAVWTGIGAIGAALVGIIWWGEAASAGRIICILMVLAGMIGLKLTA